MVWTVNGYGGLRNPLSIFLIQRGFAMQYLLKKVTFFCNGLPSKSFCWLSVKYKANMEMEMVMLYLLREHLLVCNVTNHQIMSFAEESRTLRNFQIFPPHFKKLLHKQNNLRHFHISAINLFNLQISQAQHFIILSKAHNYAETGNINRGQVKINQRT